MKNFMDFLKNNTIDILGTTGCAMIAMIIVANIFNMSIREYTLSCIIAIVVGIMVAYLIEKKRS